jgi:hypothetical protein
MSTTRRAVPREDGPGVYNTTVRALSIQRVLDKEARDTGSLKPKPIGQPAPLVVEARAAIYQAQNGGSRDLTSRQLRRAMKKHRQQVARSNRHVVSETAKWSRTTDLTRGRNHGVPA